jgi:hypothetical protein
MKRLAFLLLATALPGVALAQGAIGSSAIPKSFLGGGGTSVLATVVHSEGTGTVTLSGSLQNIASLTLGDVHLNDVVMVTVQARGAAAWRATEIYQTAGTGTITWFNSMLNDPNTNPPGVPTVYFYSTDYAATFTAVGIVTTPGTAVVSMFANGANHAIDGSSQQMLGLVFRR